MSYHVNMYCVTDLPHLLCSPPPKGVCNPIMVASALLTEAAKATSTTPRVPPMYVTMTSLSYYYDVTILLLWRHYPTTMTSLFYYYDVTILLLWRYYPTTISSLSYYYDVTTLLLWRHYPTTMTSLPYYYDVTILIIRYRYSTLMTSLFYHHSY